MGDDIPVGGRSGGEYESNARSGLDDRFYAHRSGEVGKWFVVL